MKRSEDAGLAKGLVHEQVWLTEYLGLLPLGHDKRDALMLFRDLLSAYRTVTAVFIAVGSLP
jgi:hypothetical protein